MVYSNQSSYKNSFVAARTNRISEYQPLILVTSPFYTQIRFRNFNPKASMMYSSLQIPIFPNSYPPPGVVEINTSHEVPACHPYSANAYGYPDDLRL